MKTPAFQFYPGDFISGRVATYSLAEIGAYSLLLAFDWSLNGLPTEIEKLARLCRVDPRTMRVIWRAIGEQFPERDGRRYNPRLEMEREKQKLRHSSLSANGKLGGRPTKSRGFPAASEIESLSSSASISASASVQELEDSTARAREENGGGAVVLEGWTALSTECSAEELEAVRRFLATRRTATHPAWVREMAKLITGTPYVAGDLAGACADAMALESPITGPHALRAFIAKRRDERQKASGGAGAPGSQATTFQERRAAEAREKRDLDHRAGLDRKYYAERNPAVQTWEADHPTEAAELEIRARGSLGGQMSVIAVNMRREWVVAQVVREIGFPTMDEWLARRGVTA